MVPFALPGDRLRVRVTRRRDRHSEGELLAVLRPSAARVEAPCPLFGSCGGCTLQEVRGCTFLAVAAPAQPL